MIHAKHQTSLDDRWGQRSEPESCSRTSNVLGSARNLSTFGVGIRVGVVEAPGAVASEKSSTPRPANPRDRGKVRQRRGNRLLDCWPAVANSVRSVLCGVVARLACHIFCCNPCFLNLVAVFSTQRDLCVSGPGISRVSVFHSALPLDRDWIRVRFASNLFHHGINFTAPPPPHSFAAFSAS